MTIGQVLGKLIKEYEEMENELINKLPSVKMFEIKGFTESRKYVSSGWSRTAENAAEFFLRKYPRFKGKADLRTAFLEQLHEGFFLNSSETTRWEYLDKFESAKEIKEKFKK